MKFHWYWWGILSNIVTLVFFIWTPALEIWISNKRHFVFLWSFHLHRHTHIHVHMHVLTIQILIPSLRNRLLLTPMKWNEKYEMKNNPLSVKSCGRGVRWGKSLISGRGKKSRFKMLIATVPSVLSLTLLSCVSSVVSLSVSLLGSFFGYIHHAALNCSHE